MHSTVPLENKIAAHTVNLFLLKYVYKHQTASTCVYYIYFIKKPEKQQSLRNDFHDIWGPRDDWPLADMICC